MAVHASAQAALVFLRRMSGRSHGRIGATLAHASRCARIFPFEAPFVTASAMLPTDCDHAAAPSARA